MLCSALRPEYALDELSEEMLESIPAQWGMSLKEVLRVLQRDRSPPPHAKP
jgi:hypothetical protein